MAADEWLKKGSGSSNPGGSGSSSGDQKAKDAKKQQKKTLDTQSLKVLAPGNEVARSALEMRQNLEKFVPPGPQRDQLIAQLKEDVTPLLSPALDAKQAETGEVSGRAQKERPKTLDEAIDWAASMIKGKLGHFETFGPVQEVASVPAAVVDHLRSVLRDPRRDEGEFQIAIGIKERKHFSSSRFFKPSPVETFAYERQTTEGLSDLQVSGYKITALIHAHQRTEGKDASHFSNADIEQADALQALHREISVQSYLLTPAPENIVIVYSPNNKEKLPLGETVGMFAENGNFDVRNSKYLAAYKDAKLIVS